MFFGGFGLPYSAASGFGGVVPNTTIATAPGIGFGGLPFGGLPFGGFGGLPFGGFGAPATSFGGFNTVVPNALLGTAPFGI